MGPLSLIAAAVLILATADAPPQAVAQAPSRIEHWRPYIAEAARRFRVPEAWIAAVMKAESAGLTRLNGRPITSRAGAMGLMQVMPDTYAAMRAQHRLGPDPYDPRDNILAGAAYLRALYERFGYPGLFAAYNAGPARYAAYLDASQPLPGETRAYLASLAQAPATPAMPPAILSGARLFFTLASPQPASGGLFIPLHAASGPGR